MTALQIRLRSLGAHGNRVTYTSSERLGRSCVKVEVAVLGSPSLISSYGFCGRRATMSRTDRPLLLGLLHMKLPAFQLLFSNGFYSHSV